MIVMAAEAVPNNDRNNNFPIEETSKKRRGKCKKEKLPDLPNFLLSRHVMDEFSVRFCAGSLVWAKVSGHPDPPWPGVVTEVISDLKIQQDSENPKLVKEIYQNHYNVQFFATEDWATIRHESNLWHYDFPDVDFTQKGILKLKNKPDRLNMFKKALKKIKYEGEVRSNTVKEKSQNNNQATVLNPVNVK